MDRARLNGDQQRSGAPPDGGATALAAVCWAAGTLLDRAPGPVSRLRVRCGEVYVELSWPAAPAAPAGAPAAPAASPAVPSAPEPADPEGADLAYVRAPMVGTYYHAPAPDEPPFVRVGDVVEAGQQIGILEAMKLMNPVEAERPGRVVEIVAADATPVEFDQPLVAVAPLSEEQRCSPPS